MTRYNHLRLLTIVFLIVISTLVTGQSILNSIQPEKTPKVDSVQHTIKAIPLSNINSASTQSYSLFKRIGTERMTAKERLGFESEVDNLIVQGNKFLAENTLLNFEDLNFREIERIQNQLNSLLTSISMLQDQTNLNFQKVQKGNEDLRDNKQKWNLTLQNSSNNVIPPAIISRIKSVISTNDSISNLLENDLNFLLTQSDKVTGVQIHLNRFSDDLLAYTKISGAKLFRLDLPPIWKIFSESETTTSSKKWLDFKNQFSSSTRTIYENHSKRFILILCILIVLIGLVYWLRGAMQNLELDEGKSVLGLFLVEIFKKPFEVSLLIGLYLIWLLIPDIPPSYALVIAIITIYAISRMAFTILAKDFWKYIIGLAVAYLLFRFYGLFYDYLILGRIMLLLAQLFALEYVINFLIDRKKLFAKKKILLVASAYLGALFLIFLILALIGNVFGTISFSEYLSGGVVKSAFHILTVYIGFQILAAIFYILINSPLTKGSNIVEKQSIYIFEKFYKLLTIFFVIIWILISLEQFKIRGVIIDWGKGILFHENFIGETPFTLMSIILFVFVIWLSIFVSRIVRHILQEEVFPRVKVEKGMPGTIIMLVRIILVSVGFFLAAAAAGLDISSLAIIIGAFSVGIGFGLQNIFNNLVSGLILAFERPIKEGDIVEVNTLLGTVKSIGIRSSIIKTFSGSEVIVPNGELISKELTNWTLSDQYRRSDVRIGVAYGTNPEIVIALLLRIANENPRVNKEPLPRALFIDFADSSLNFRLLVWVDQDFRIDVESELRIAINKGLKEAGIEIPFPQTDIHVKSVTDDAGKKLK